MLCCGRRWGKTQLAIERTCVSALRSGKPVAWFSPTYKDSMDVWRQCEETLRDVMLSINKQERRINLISGSIDFWSLEDPDSGRGRAYALAIVDEAAKVPKLEAAWTQSIRPMLTDYSGGAWFLSTPKGTTNYFHSLYQRGLSGEDWASWRMPTAANPFIRATEIESAKSDLTDLAFAQEYMAQFVVWEGAVFRRILDAVYEIPPNITINPAVAIGVDWARTTDYTVFIAISTAGQVLAIDRFRGAEYSVQRARLRAFWERMGSKSWIFAEANSMGGPVIEQLQHDGMPVAAFTTTNASKTQMVESLAMAFERCVIKIPNDPVLVGELQAFESKPLPSGMMRYSAPDGEHDDTVIALALAWQGLGGWERAREQARNGPIVQWEQIGSL